MWMAILQGAYGIGGIALYGEVCKIGHLELDQTAPMVRY